MTRYQKYMSELSYRRRILITIGYWIIGIAITVTFFKQFKEVSSYARAGDALPQAIGYCLGFFGGSILLTLIVPILVSIFYRLTHTPHPLLTLPIGELRKELIARIMPWCATTATILFTGFLIIEAQHIVRN